MCTKFEHSGSLTFVGFLRDADSLGDSSIPRLKDFTPLQTRILFIRQYFCFLMSELKGLFFQNIWPCKENVHHILPTQVQHARSLS
jgi:hypothetical protein